MPPPAAAPIRYQVMTTVPENWIPFIPVHVPGDNREIQLQRAALPRILDGDPDPPAQGAAAHACCCARASTARRPQPYFVFEEEVPRAGTRADAGLRAHALDRRPRLHLAAGAPADRPRRRHRAGSRFDKLIDVPPAP